MYTGQTISLNEEASTARGNPTEATCTITHEETQVSKDSNGDAKHSGDDTGENAAPENESLQGGSNNGTSGNLTLKGQLIVL